MVYVVFLLGFWVQGLFLSATWAWYKKLSSKRNKRQISEAEKWQQGSVSLIAKPILEVVVRKDPVGMRAIYSISVLNSTVLAIFLCADFSIIWLSIIIFACIWLSLNIEN
jgi:hypothetical protein